MTSKSKATAKTSKVSARKSDHDRIFYLASLIDNISDALISTDLEFKVLEWKAAAEAMYGWTAAEVIGHQSGDFIHSKYENTTREDIIRAVLEEGIWKGEATERRKDGSRFPVMASVSLIKNETGKPVGLVFLNRELLTANGRNRSYESWRSVSPKRFIKAPLVWSSLI